MKASDINELKALKTVLPTGFRRFSLGVGCKARLLLLPDWQGANTQYMQRMAELYSRAIKAEIFIFHPYEINNHPFHYNNEGRGAVYNVLHDRNYARNMMQDALVQLEHYWTNKDIPLIIVGFCLGGTLSFEAARIVDHACLVVSIHGNPSTDLRIEPQSTKTPMVFIDGGADPLIPRADVHSFLWEMQLSNRQWFSHTLGQSRHSFTKEEIGTLGPGSVYNLDSLNLSVDLVTSHIKQLVN
ncbi:hypothetical protein BGP78_13820 [Pseudoalteromonas sp. MSK9-3]|uniref:dienelactone hydrolase family protein n=1 Tax=Pseudoalteromonas sp. MSK9-3 TaxID=1897633 RepID=UPI000E6B61DF|nr:dienelactone hydrolase family protein [Pseudoalteromonas sp. MSK9-3]RJE76086.1 hypothetical protein BGP78_13820 [Pseudoalteromonas sp. MSK9-3]